MKGAKKVEAKFYQPYFTPGKKGTLWTSDPILIRFLDKVKFRKNAVWEFTGGRSGGYGQFWNGEKNEYAHRFIYRYWTGEDISSKQVLHDTDIPWDCNPNHLKSGSAQDNLQDAAAKGRLKGRKPRGKAIVGEEKQAIIKEMFEGVSNNKISKKYCRSQGSLTTFKKRLSLEKDSVAFVGSLTLAAINQACDKFKQDLKPVVV